MRDYKILLFLPVEAKFRLKFSSFYFYKLVVCLGALLWEMEGESPPPPPPQLQIVVLKRKSFGEILRYRHKDTHTDSDPVTFTNDQYNNISVNNLSDVHYIQGEAPV